MNPEPPRGRRAPRSEALAARALEALHALARDLARARVLDPAALPERLELRLDLDLARGFSPGVERSLLENLEARIDAALRAAAALRAGRAYCFFCASSDCAHSAPTEADQVFDGYEATGRPRWIDLPSVLLGRRDPRVDDLYERRGLAALVQEAGELKGDLIDAFVS